MTHNSKVAWKTVNKLNAVNQPPPRMAGVTPNQVAHQLLLNGKPLHKERGCLKQMKTEMRRIMEDSDDLFTPFAMSELNEALKHVKAGKAAGLDGIGSEMIQHFGPRTLEWILTLFNSCATEC